MPEQKQVIHILAESRRKLDIKRHGENKMIFIGLAFLALAGGAYGGMMFYLSRLNAQLEDISSQVESLDYGRDKDFEKEILAINRQLSSASQLVKDHIVWSQGLAKLQTVVLPTVRFASLEGNTEGTIVISAVAPSLTAVAKQMVAFLEDEVFTNVSLGGLDHNTEGMVAFDLSVKFNKKTLLIQSLSSPEEGEEETGTD